MVDAGGRGYISETSPAPGRIYSYDGIATLNGSIAPTRIISGPATLLSGPTGLYLTP